MKKISYKVTLSVVLIIVGASFAVMFSSNSSSTRSSDGIVIDFGDRDIVYVSMNTSDVDDSLSALKYACEHEGFSLVIEGNEIISIDSLPTVEIDAVWELFVTPHGSREWTRAEGNPSEIIIKNYSVVAWGLCAEGEFPTPGVDATGYNFYNYDQPRRSISLAPSCTETVCSIGALNTIVGTDMYSNYPNAVVENQKLGKITVVGGYTNPSYELIIQQNPDMVICIASQVSHTIIAEKLRKIGIDVIVTFDGEDINTILDNIYMVGTGMNYSIPTKKTLESINEAMDSVYGDLENYAQIRYPNVMIALSAVKSPWVSGSGTYVSDILDFTFSNNVYEGQNGWVQVNSESIMQYNPSMIIMVNSEYPPTEDAYNQMLSSLSAEWKKTNAYASGEIYLLTEVATDLASRPGPRVAQLTELTARILHPDAFEDKIIVPKIIGNNYEDYLTYTKDLNFNGGGY